jgi:hypothetical protein
VRAPRRVHAVLPRPHDAPQWIAELAEPYLRGYAPVIQSSGSLCGFWFLNPSFSSAGNTQARKEKRVPETALGFFVGYLVSNKNFAFLKPQPPECLVFAFVHPVGGKSHRHLVDTPASLVHRTFEYIRWLTHRPPRFEFHARGAASLVRHLSMREWPQGKYQHYSRNFFIESLAWLVRSSLVKKLLAERPATRSASKLHRDTSRAIPR